MKLVPNQTLRTNPALTTVQKQLPLLERNKSNGMFCSQLFVGDSFVVDDDNDNSFIVAEVKHK